MELAAWGRNPEKRGCCEKLEKARDQMEAPLEITPAEAREKLAHQKAAALVDVREPKEFAVAQIGGSLLIPMQSVPARLQQLESIADDKDLLILCHHGVRSLQVAAWLRARGIENAFSIAGGIDRWSREIDESVPRY
jgi:rhodanese-related sulfurtransferase